MGRLPLPPGYQDPGSNIRGYPVVKGYNTHQKAHLVKTVQEASSGVAQWLACWAHNLKVPESKAGFAMLWFYHVCGELNSAQDIIMFLLCLVITPTVNLPTNIMDFRESSRILNLRDEIPRHIADFPECLNQAILLRIILVGRLGAPRALEGDRIPWKRNMCYDRATYIGTR